MRCASLIVLLSVGPLLPACGDEAAPARPTGDGGAVAAADAAANPTTSVPVGSVDMQSQGVVDGSRPTAAVDVAVPRPGVDAQPSLDVAVDRPPGAVDSAGPAIDVAMGTMPVIVGVGYGGLRILSVDEGRNFCEVAVAKATPPNQDDENLLREVHYASGIFLSGGFADLWLSGNGFDWEDVTGMGRVAMGGFIGGIRYGNGLWLATGGNGAAMRSTDARKWTAFFVSGRHQRSLAFGDGLFVTAGDDGAWLESRDTMTWKPFAGMATGNSVDFIGGKFVVRELTRMDGRGISLRYQGGFVERMEGASAWQRVATWSPTTMRDTATARPSQSIERFAFGFAPSGDFARTRIPAATAACLRLP